MKTGIGLSEILLILALMVVFVNPKQIPGLIRKTVKITGQLRAAVREYLDGIRR